MLGKWRAVVIPPLLAAVISAWTTAPPTPTFEGTRSERYVQGMAHYKEVMAYPYSVEVKVVPEHDAWCAWVQSLGAGRAEAGFVDPPSEGCRSLKPETLALHESCHLRMMHVEAAFTMTREAKEHEVKRCMIWYGRNR